MILILKTVALTTLGRNHSESKTILIGNFVDVDRKFDSLKNVPTEDKFRLTSTIFLSIDFSIVI